MPLLFLFSPLQGLSWKPVSRLRGEWKKLFIRSAAGKSERVKVIQGFGSGGREEILGCICGQLERGCQAGGGQYGRTEGWQAGAGKGAFSLGRVGFGLEVTPPVQSGRQGTLPASLRGCGFPE